MKFGVREICEVVFRAKKTMKVGNKTFYKDEPVIYFDSLKTSTVEGAATTVYAQGGRGNARLVAWEGERTVTFTMEDALISLEGLQILTGAGLVSEGEVQPVHTTDTIGKTETITSKDVGFTYSETDGVTIKLDADAPVSSKPNVAIYVMPLKGGEIIAEPFVGNSVSGATQVTIAAKATGVENFAEADAVLIDYYVDRAKAKQVNVTPESFGGNFYIEASTLFRNEDGVDMPAEFIIPNAKVQSNFTFSMASSGDPSTFTFTMDSFPDYTRFNTTEKVYFSIQVIEDITDSEDKDSRDVTVTKVDTTSSN